MGIHYGDSLLQISYGGFLWEFLIEIFNFNFSAQPIPVIVMGHSVVMGTLFICNHLFYGFNQTMISLLDFFNHDFKTMVLWY